MARRDELPSHPRGPYFFGPSRTPEHTVPTEGVEQAGSLVNFDSVDANRRIINLWDGALVPISQLSRVGHKHAGEDITTGTLADARLSANVPLKNANNVFTGTNTLRALLAGGNNLYDIGASATRFKKGWLYELDLAGALNVQGQATLRGSLDMVSTRIINLGDPDSAVRHHAPNVGWVKDYVRDIASTKTTYSDLWDEMIVTGVNMEMRDSLGNRVSAGNDMTFISTDGAEVIHVFPGIAYVEGRRCMVNATDIMADDLGGGEYILYFDAPRVGDPAQGESSENYYADVTYVIVDSYAYDEKNHERAVGKFTVDPGDLTLGAQFFSHYAWGRGVSGKTFIDSAAVKRTLHDPHGAKLFATIGGSYDKRLVAYRANQYSLYPALSGLDLGTPAGGSANTPDGLEWSFIYGKSGRFSSSLQVGGKNVSLSDHTHNYLPGATNTNDWNAPADAGLARMVTGAGPEGTRTHIGISVTHKDYATYVTQFSGRSGAYFIRSMEAGTWQNWYQLYHTGFKPTAADVGAQPAKAALDQVNAHGVTYGSIGVSGLVNNYAGIVFTGTAQKWTFMVENSTTGRSGLYRQDASLGWSWMWDNGVLTVGTVPAGRVTGGTFPDSYTIGGALDMGADKIFTAWTGDSANWTNRRLQIKGSSGSFIFNSTYSTGGAGSIYFQMGNANKVAFGSDGNVHIYAGNLYIRQAGNNRIYSYDSTGVYRPLLLHASDITLDAATAVSGALTVNNGVNFNGDRSKFVFAGGADYPGFVMQSAGTYPRTWQVFVHSGVVDGPIAFYDQTGGLYRMYLYPSGLEVPGYVKGGSLEVTGKATLKGGTVNQYGHNLRPVIVSATAPSTTAEEGTIWIQI